MSEYIYFGLTSQSIDLFANDTSSTVGAGLAGLLHNSPGIQAAYRIGASGTVTSFSLVTQTVGAAWVSGGFVEVDSSLMKGVYRLDLPNVVSGTEAFVTVYLSGAANMGPIVLRLDCKPIAVDVKRVASQSANASAAVTFPSTIASTTNITTATGITVSTNNDKTAYSLATAPPTSSAIATAVANILYVDGAANKLKVNPDNTVNATVSGTIVNYVTIPSAVAQASILAAQITAVRGDTLTVALPIMGSLTGRTGLVFTAKKTVSDLDSEAILQVSESSGLLILNGSSTVVGTAQLSVTNATTGAVNLTLSAATTATIPLLDYLWDCQTVLSSGVSTPINGVLSVTGDVTRSTS